MKMYCGMLVNELTGEIEHCATSDRPVTKAMLPEPIANLSPVKTVPPTPTPTYRTCFCEFDCAEFTRGKEVLENITVETKNSKSKLIVKSGSRLTNLKETNESRL